MDTSVDVFPFLSLLGLFVMTFLGNGTVPLPVTAYILWLGQYDVPLAVVIVGTLGTVSGWVLIGNRVGRLVRNKTVNGWVERMPPMYKTWLLQYPGFFVFVFNALPFSVDIVRILALVYGIPPWRLVFPLAVGRLIRYTILVSLGAYLAQYSGYFWVLIALILVPLLYKTLTITVQQKWETVPAAAPEGEPSESVSG